MNYLAKGKHIGIIALSAACERQRFQKGVSALEEKGFRCRIALDPCCAYGTTQHLFSSDSPTARAHALHDLVGDPDVGLILSARGAYGSAEILPLLDFDLLRANTTLIVGFSDTTAILLALYRRGVGGLIHGPSLESSFSKLTDNADALRSANQLIDFVTGAVRNPFESGQYEQLVVGDKGHGKGPLVGGNLTVLSSMAGTPWEVSFDNHVLFLEEVGEKPYRVHRMLCQLKSAGKMKKLKGVLLGSFKNCAHNKGLGPSLEDVFLDVFKNAPFPVLRGLPFGHEDLNFPLPLGTTAHIVSGRLEFNS